MYSGKAPTLTEGDVFVAQVPVPWNTQIDGDQVRILRLKCAILVRKCRILPEKCRIVCLICRVLDP